MMSLAHAWSCHDDTQGEEGGVFRVQVDVSELVSLQACYLVLLDHPPLGMELATSVTPDLQVRQ